MRVGVIVEGTAESQSLKILLRRLELSEAQIVDVLYADLQPMAAAGQIVQKARSRIEILRRRAVDRIIVLVDREQRRDCPGEWARELTSAFASGGQPLVHVVVKNVCYENWLIADPDALRLLTGWFRVTDGFERLVAPDKADNVQDPVRQLNRICRQGKNYHKAKTAQAIAEKQDCLRMARNSRSFRRFLRLAGHANYVTQSRRP